MVGQTFLRIMVKLGDIDKQTRRYGTDETLHIAEIHTIKAIKENTGISVTGLARLMGVTKGAVSQTIAKLARKGMIIKQVDQDNLSRLGLTLTPKGETAYAYHEKLHDEYERIFRDLLKAATEENKAFVRELLCKLESRIDKEQASLTHIEAAGEAPQH